jgi:hypothetical protein
VFTTPASSLSADRAPELNQPFIWAISFVAALGGLLFGYDWVVIGGAKPFFEKFFQLDSEELKGWANSCALVGCLVGSLVSGGLSDKFGRKKLLILSAFLFAVSSILTGWAPSFNVFVAWRIVGGMAIGMASNLSPMYIAEIAPASMRGRLVSINQLTIVIGIVLAQVANLLIADNLPSTALHVWRSNNKEQFVQIDPIQPKQNAFQITLEPGAIYSLTTTKGQQKGGAVPPASKPFPFPYAEDFETYSIGATPRYTSDYAGIFAVVNRDDGKGKALRQMIAPKGIEWQKNAFPETFIGSLKWTDYEVSVDALIESATDGFASLFGRVGNLGQDRNPPSCYWLKVDQSGKWELSDKQVKLDDKNKKIPFQSVVASGNVSFAPMVWHNLKLRFLGSRITVFIDDKSVAEVEDKTRSSGMVGFGSGWHGAQFDNLTIRP